MLSAASSFWDSKLDAPVSGLGPAFAASEAPTLDEGHQLAAILREPVHAGHLDVAYGSSFEQLLLIDESVFDFADIPELEDVDGQFGQHGEFISTSPNDLPFDDIPALEDVPDDEVNWPSWASESTSDPIAVVSEPTSIKSTPAVPLIKLELDDEHLTSGQAVTTTVPQVTRKTSFVAVPTKILFEADQCVVTGYEEEVLADSSAPALKAYPDSSVGCASPASVYSVAYSTSSSGIGGSSPFSNGGFTSADELAGLMSPAEKKRRISQVSVSSFCSSVGPMDSVGSPASSTSGAASDSDHFERKVARVARSSTGGGRRSRFTPEDRKERKKAQNRTAAERYRQKRRQAEEVISEEEQVLIDDNTKLRTEVTKLEAEVSCMKRLMREMLLAKGIAIPPAPSPKKKSKTS